MLLSFFPCGALRFIRGNPPNHPWLFGSGGALWRSRKRWLAPPGLSSSSYSSDLKYREILNAEYIEI